MKNWIVGCCASRKLKSYNILGILPHSLDMKLYDPSSFSNVDRDYCVQLILSSKAKSFDGTWEQPFFPQ